MKYYSLIFLTYLFNSCVDGPGNIDAISIINKTGKNLEIVSYNRFTSNKTDTIRVKANEDYHHFFVDDGSTSSGTKNIFKEFSDSIIIFFAQEKYIIQKCSNPKYVTTGCDDIIKNVSLIREKGEAQKIRKKLTDGKRTSRACWQYSITFDESDYNRAIIIQK